MQSAAGLVGGCTHGVWGVMFLLLGTSNVHVQARPNIEALEVGASRCYVLRMGSIVGLFYLWS